MGTIASRFSFPFFFKKTPAVLRKELEDINQKILDVEIKKTKLRHHQSILIELIVIYSKILYVCVAVVFFFSTIPSSIIEYIIFAAPLICFHVLVYALKGAVNWYYKYEVESNNSTLRKLKQKKKETLTKVKETMSFKEASEIIETYEAEKPLVINDCYKHKISGKYFEEVFQYIDVVINAIFGEKRKNALICANCQWHNGMALEDECETIGFRCCKCRHLNLPKQKKKN